MKKTNKIIACISALCMAFSTSVINVSAENAIGDIPSANIIDDNGVLKYDTEKCGDNISWSFDDETGTLTLSGTGSTYDYLIGSPIKPDRKYIQKPWYEYEENITNVVIEEGITNIGSNLFCKYNSIKSVTLPESLESIGRRAFLSCSIENLTLPSNLKRIGNDAFVGNSMKELIIPEGVTDTGLGSFRNCSELVSVVIPSTLENSVDLFCACTSLTDVKISDGIEVIGSSMFRKCTSLTDIVIPDSVKILESNTFDECSSLSNVKLSDNLETIEGGAFDNCSSLENISIPSSVSYIGEFAFKNTPLIDNQETYVKYADKWAVDCWYSPENPFNLDSIDLRDDTVGIAYSAFSGFRNVKSVVIPASVKYINANAFEGCLSLTDITIDNPDCIISDRAAGPFYNIVWCDNNTKISIVKLTIEEMEMVVCDSNSKVLIKECLDSERKIYKAVELNSGKNILIMDERFIVIGDANIDGYIDIRDAAALKKDIVKLEVLPDYAFTADINTDGVVDVKDLGMLNKYIIKAIDKF